MSKAGVFVDTIFALIFFPQEFLLTRNLKDYKKAVIQVMNPETFLSGL